MHAVHLHLAFQPTSVNVSKLSRACVINHGMKKSDWIYSLKYETDQNEYSYVSLWLYVTLVKKIEMLSCDLDVSPSDQFQNDSSFWAGLELNLESELE